MDLDAILARRPELVLVDELAHTNAPGSRHPKRWLDVEELLDAGIDVYTTVNIQHLESLNDVVAQITGVRVRETVPDRVLERADEVKLVDLPPEELLQRLQRGQGLRPRRRPSARSRNYFQPGNLTALRELALRETAEHVDEQMQAHRGRAPSPDTWAVSRARAGGVSGGDAVRAPRARGAPHGGAARRAVARGLRRAAALRRSAGGGARARASGAAARGAARRRGGHDSRAAVADELVRFARERNVTEIMLGKPPRSRWRDAVAALRRSTRSSVGAATIDVRVVSGDRLDATREARGSAGAPARAGRAPATARPVRLRRGRDRDRGARRRRLDGRAPARGSRVMVFLAAVLMSAWSAVSGRRSSASVIGLLVYDFFFVEPQSTRSP